MGIYDRDYSRDEDSWGMGQGGRGGGYRPRAGGPRTWSVVTWLIILNVLGFLIDHGFNGGAHYGYASREQLFSGHVYLLLTYQFVHADLFHLLFNMLVLYFWGYQLQRIIGTQSFLWLYFGAGVFGGLLQLLSFTDAPSTPMIGASAAVMGVVFGIISVMPRQVVTLLLFFVLPIRAAMWKIGAFIVAIEVVMFLAQDVFGMTMGENGIANLAHLGGAAFGWFWITWILPRRQGSYENQYQQKRWSDRFGTKRVVEAEVVTSDNKKPKKEKKKKDAAFVTPEVDAILDKINEQGMHSLTDKEKKVLEKHSEQLAKRNDRR